MSVLADASTQFGLNVLNGGPRSNDGSNHANDRHYQEMRDRARDAQSKGSHFASQASNAYQRGDKAEASELSQKAKKLRSEADQLNEEAAAWVFRENNTDSAADEIDLHGLYVKEALVALDARLQVCAQHNQPVLKAIVGKGLHSETHIAKLRPAVMDHCKEKGLRNEVDQHNPGMVIIHVPSSGGGFPQPGQPQHQQYPQQYPQQQPQQGGYTQGGQQYAQGGQQPYSQGGQGGQQGPANIVEIICSLIKQCF